MAFGLAVAAMLLPLGASAADHGSPTPTVAPATAPVRQARGAPLPQPDVRKPFSELFGSLSPDQAELFRSRLGAEAAQLQSYTRRVGPCGMLMIEHQGRVDEQARVPAPAGNFATRRMTPTVCSQQPPKR
jgi:hypothetical protein